MMRSVFASPPGPAYANLLRSGRTAALWLVSPFDALVRRLAGRPALPPLWLRRHAGPPAAFESSAHDMSAFLDRLGVLRESDAILDIGCGAGSMLLELAGRLGPEQRYVGFDVHAASVRWCRRRFRSDKRLRFELARIASPYGSRFGQPVASYRFPVDDRYAGLVMAKSVFTHLFEQDALAYLREIRRVLIPGRPAIVTAFLFDGENESAQVLRAFPFGDGRVRWRSDIRPTAAVAYARSAFFQMIGDSGLRVQWMSPGYFPGTEQLKGQDILLLGH
jgi:ubiquinone/menaquinone biosynthesis C-methylase UbiE